MARKNSTATKSGPARTSTKSISTPVRNSAIPKPSAIAAVAKKPMAITEDAIAKRAYEIYLSGSGGSESDNWFRAERELRGGI